MMVVFRGRYDGCFAAVPLLGTGSAWKFGGVLLLGAGATLGRKVGAVIYHHPCSFGVDECDDCR